MESETYKKYMQELYNKELGGKTKELETQIQDIWNKNYDPQYQTTYKQTMGNILEKINKEKWDREKKLAKAEFEYKLANEREREQSGKYKLSDKGTYQIYRIKDGKKEVIYELNYVPSSWYKTT